MLFRQLFDHASCTYSYLIASAVGREAAIIDPVVEHMQHYLRLIAELKLKLVFSIDTHTHTDHITASGALLEMVGSKIVMGNQTSAEFVNRSVVDDEVIAIDGLILRALYTPGHTKDSYCFLLKDRVFTGDTLLIRGTGRTDFADSDPYESYHSIQQRLMNLPDEIFVYPAHDYHGLTVSTIAEERAFNPRLQVKSAAEYADLMNNLKLDKPKMFDVAIPANLKCGVGYRPLHPYHA